LRFQAHSTAEGGNPPQDSNMVGPKFKFSDPEELQARVNAYFTSREEKNLPFTVTGLALALGTNRATLCNYEDLDEKETDKLDLDTRKRIVEIVQTAKQRCEDYAEIQLLTGRNQTGAIFALKNYGWKDKSETDITTQGDKIQSGVVILPQRNDSSLATTTEAS
jgi:hypothetical protein